MNFYFQAASVLDRVDGKEGSIKGLLASLPDKDRKRTAALVIETLKFRAVLSDVIAASQLLRSEKKINSQSLALVLVHDFLLAPGGIQAGDGPIKQAIFRHKARLNGEFQRLKVKRGVKGDQELAATADKRAASIPRYVRVNTLKWSTDEAITFFRENGFAFGDPLNPGQFTRDAHIPDLLLFPAQTSFQDNPAYTSGKIILQDKASCFPAVVLAPPVSDKGTVIDATAAPGNKTSQLSALMMGKGTLLAFERDRRRFGTLKSMLSKAGCTNVYPCNADFLATDPAEEMFANVTHILLDPSCSGSGIVNRLDYLLDTEDDISDDQEKARLAKLATFQLLMIRHAMRSDWYQVSTVKKIVYSTCSVHAAENEDVVVAALKTPEAIAGGFVLASRDDVLPSWHRRGLGSSFQDATIADSMIRCSPDEDATNGFFVSCFIRHVPGKRKLDGDGEGVHSGKKKRKSKKIASGKGKGIDA